MAIDDCMCMARCRDSSISRDPFTKAPGTKQTSYTQIYLRTKSHTHIYIYIYICIYTYIYIQLCIYIYICTYMYIHLCREKRLCIYAHTCCLLLPINAMSPGRLWLNRWLCARGWMYMARCVRLHVYGYMSRTAVCIQ